MALMIGSQLPCLDDVADWIYDLDFHWRSPGHPTLIQVWAISCPMCKHNMPRLQNLVKGYAKFGLQLISIHMPRSESDMDVEKVKVAVQELGLLGPCAIDNDHAIGNLFQTGGVWPYYFLFDAEGKLRSRAAGSLGLKMAENSLKRLLELKEASHE